MDTADWRTQIKPDWRQRIVNKIWKITTSHRVIPRGGEQRGGLTDVERTCGFENHINNFDFWLNRVLRLWPLQSEFGRFEDLYEEVPEKSKEESTDPNSSRCSESQHSKQELSPEAQSLEEGENSAEFEDGNEYNQYTDANIYYENWDEEDGRSEQL